MRKHLGLAALALAGALGLGSGPALAVDVTIWCWDTNFNGAAMREAAARYNATHPDVNIIIDDSDTQDNIRQKLQTQLLAGTTEGLPDIVLIQDDQAQEVPALLPGCVRAAQRLDRYDAVRELQGRGRDGRRQVLLAALRLGRHRPLLSLRLLRGSRVHRRGPAEPHLGPADRDRQDGQGEDRPRALRHRLQRSRLDPHDAELGRPVVLQSPMAR